MTFLRYALAPLFALVLALSAGAATAGHLISGTDTLSTLYIEYAGTALVTAPLVYGGTATAGDASWAGKVVLLDREGTPFAQKVAAVRDAGGLALIVANNAAGNAAVSLGATNATTFPAVTVSQADGLTLRARAGQTVTVRKDLPPPITPDMAALEARLAAIEARVAAIEAAKPDPNAPVVIGTKVVLMATYDNTTAPAPTFQWAKDGAPLAGETHVSLYFHAIQSNDAGTYTVTAANSAGAATSPPMLLAVQP